MDELLGRKTPHSAPAEQAVIGSMLIDTRCIPEVLEKLKADEFYSKLNRDIYETINTMFSYGQTIDPVTVLDQMKVRGVYQEGNESYMAEVMRVTPTAANVLEYAAIVRDRALLRRLGEAADEINNMVYEGSGEAETMLEAAERRIYALRQGRNVGGLMPVSAVVQNVFDNLSEAAASGEKIPGISTGLPDLDRVTLGLNKSELILIAARRGRTIVSLNPKHFRVSRDIARGVFSIGIPSALQNLFNVISLAVLTRFATAYGSEAVSAMGIANKVYLVPLYTAMGIALGLMPLVSYNYSSGNSERLKTAVRYGLRIAVAFVAVVAVLLCVFAPQVVRLFIKNDTIIEYGTHYLRGLSLGLPFFAIDILIVSSVFNACGMGGRALLFALLRKVVLQIPLLILLNRFFPPYGIAYAELIAELFLAVVALITLRKIFRQLDRKSAEAKQEVQP